MKKNWLFIFLFGAVLLQLACHSIQHTATNKKQPDWVLQRPINTQYYIGIGYANKLRNPNDYQRVAKKNALDDMMGEIKVSVSSHSVLSQQQNNQQFSQQFFSDTKLISSETLEGFEVPGSWENAQDFWIYYRFSKAEYEAQKRRRLMEAVDKAKDLMNRADQLSLQSDFTASLKLKCKAAIALQNYLNESIEAEYKGRTVYLMNELIAQIQQQLYLVQLKTSETVFKVSAGKSLVQPVIVSAQLRENDKLGNKIQFLPLQLMGSGLKFSGNNSAETQLNGEAQFIVNNIQGATGIRSIQAKIDLSKLIAGDSLLPSMRRLLLNLEGPQATLQLQIEPIKIFLESTEKNMAKSLQFGILEPTVKKYLADLGCAFVSKKEESDYTLHIDSDTKDQGIMWGNMLRASIEMNLILTDTKTSIELMHEAVSGITGFQVSPEKAGMDAYQNMRSEMSKKLLPALQERLFPENR
jgi:hypothetical protein